MNRIITVSIVALTLVGGAKAQVPPGGQGGAERLRILETEQRRALAPTEYLKRPRRDYTAFNYGGWSATTYFNFKDDDNVSTALDTFHGLLRTDYRAWAHAVTRDDLGVYVRLRKINHHYYTGVGVADPDTSKFDAFDLDLGYVDLPVRKARVRVGRQFLQAGRGLSLADNLDGISGVWQKGNWAVQVFFARTSPMAENLDITVAPLGSGGAFRNYNSAQASYTTKRGRRLYGYYLVENDETRAVPPLTGPHEYDARYWSLGWEGPIQRKLTGYTEYLHESGRTASQNILGAGALVSSEVIDADAVVAALTYLCGDRRATTLAVEYAIGSGDPDRGSVVNNLLVGNRPGTRDTCFNYFGTWDLGLALSPRLSNLEVLRLGYSLKPILDRHGRPRDLQVGVKGSLYAKNTGAGAISSTTATRANRAFSNVGSAVDVFAAWRPYHDWSIAAMWGTFDPGSAYSPGFDSPTDRLLVNVTSSF